MASTEKHALITGSSRGIGEALRSRWPKVTSKLRSIITSTRGRRTRHSRKSASVALMAFWCRPTSQNRKVSPRCLAR